MLKGFRDFILRGNVIDLAVAVILGVAFNGIVGSLVNDILTPLISAVGGKPDFGSLILNLHGGHIRYGNFLNAVINFLVMAGVIYFGVVLPMNHLMGRIKPPAPPVPPATKPCAECLSEIPIAARRCSHCAQPVA